MATRLTTAELFAILDAITSVTAGDSDNWRAAEWQALEHAEDKIRRQLHARRDYETVRARLDASPEQDGSEVEE